MTSTPALHCTSASSPLEATAIERRELRGARRPDRDPLLRHLPQRHPPGQGRVGRFDLPDGARPRDRRHRDRRRPRRDAVRGRRPRRRRLHGRLVRRVRAVPGGRGAVLQRPVGTDVQRTGLRRRRRPTAATAGKSSYRAVRRADPRRARARRRRAAAVRRHHDLQPAEDLGRRSGQEGRGRRAWAVSATSR